VAQKHPARPAALEALAVRHVWARPTSQGDRFLLGDLAGLVRLSVRAVLVGLARLAHLVSLAALVRLWHPQVPADLAALPLPSGLEVQKVRALPFPLVVRATPVRLFRLAVLDCLGSLTDPQDQNIRRSGGLQQKQSPPLTGASFPPAIFLAARFQRKKVMSTEVRGKVTIEKGVVSNGRTAMQSRLPMTRPTSVFVCPRTHMMFAALVVLVACHSARAQDDIKPPNLEIPKSGVAQPFPADAAVPSGAADARLFSTIAAEEALATQFKEAIPHTRGPQDISLFREAAPSVVLILAKGALGSGSLLHDNEILTNLHVVDNNREVTVVFKPADPNGKATADEVVKADVVKIDVQRDLALLRPRSLPNRTVRPLQVSSQDIEVGADVRAIGHPKGGGLDIYERDRQLGQT
jgi:Trypsin-like peptidase domain